MNGLFLNITCEFIVFWDINAKFDGEKLYKNN